MPYRIERAATPSVRTHEGDAAGGGWPPAGDEPAGDETQPLEKLLPPARRRLAAGPAGGDQARSEKEVGVRHRSAKSELR